MKLLPGIKYIEKGIELHDEISEKGFTLIRKDKVWLCDDIEAVQKIIDNFDELEAVKKTKIKELKEHEQKIIFATKEGIAAKRGIDKLRNAGEVRTYDVSSNPGWEK